MPFIPGGRTYLVTERIKGQRAISRLVTPDTEQPELASGPPKPVRMPPTPKR